MAYVTDFPAYDELVDIIIDAFETGRQQYIELEEEHIDLARELTLDHVITIGGWGRGLATVGETDLEVSLFVGLDNQAAVIPVEADPARYDPFQAVTSAIVDYMLENVRPTAEMVEWFPDLAVVANAVSVFDEAMTWYLQQREPNHAVDMLNRHILVLEGTDITRHSVGQYQAGHDETEEGSFPSDILQYTELEDLHDRIETAFTDAVTTLQEEDGSNQDRYGSHQYERAIITPPWGNGTATRENNTLQMRIVMGGEGTERPSINLQAFDIRAEHIIDQMEEEIEWSDTMRQWFGNITMIPTATDLFAQNMDLALRNADPARVFDLTNISSIEIRDGQIVSTEYTIADTPAQEPTEEPEQEPTPVPPTEEELLEREYPVIEPELRQFAINEDALEIPAGKKTKQVEPRQIYAFEEELAAPLDADTEIDETITEGIGHTYGLGAIGTDVPASTFPRTSTYVKYYLKYEGPAYMLELYNNLVVYAGYISSVFDMRLKPGSYDSFRQYMYRLEQVEKRDLGPVLVRPIPRSEAEDRGFDTMSKIPVGDGERRDAPWLEPRQYYEVNEESMDHEAWHNVAEFLYEAQQA